MRIVCIADTHGDHLQLFIPDGDVLVCAGDFSAHGTYLNALKFVNWLGAQPHKYKILVAGNHDLFLERGNPSEIDMFIRTMPPSVTYLLDSDITIDGVKFWGSPVQPTFLNWAFNRDRGADILKHWDLIHNDTDVLITHGPAYKVLDDTWDFDNRIIRYVGCKDLTDAIKRVRPIVHIFGHVHYSGGKVQIEKDLISVNASMMDENYKIVNKPIIIDIDITQRKATHVI